MTISLPRLTLMLAMLVAVTPLAIDMYLPAMQLMATDLDAPIHHVELSISGYLFGFALGQIAGGTLSDRWGRKPAVTLGLLIFSVTSLALMYVESVDALLVLRVFQALGGGIAVVNASAIVRDLYSGKEMARVLSMIAMVMLIAPLIAPLLGALVTEILGWRVIFLTLAVYAGMVGVVFVWMVPESRARLTDGERPRMFAAYLNVFRHRVAMTYVLVLSFSFSGMFAFITAAPFAYLEYFDVSPSLFPVLFGANIITMMLCGRINMRLLNRYGPNCLLLAGLSLQSIAGVGLVLASLWDGGLGIVVVLNMLFVGSLGLIAANATTGCLHFFPEMSASANAVIGVVEFCMGALVGLIWTQLHDYTLVPMAVVMATCAGLGLLSLLSMRQIFPHSDNESISLKTCVKR